MRPTTPVGRALRCALLVLGLAVLVYGIAWSTVSMARPSPDLPPTRTTLVAVAATTAPCISVGARREMERESCLYAVQRELIEGRLTLEEAAERLRACDNLTPEMEAALARRNISEESRHTAQRRRDLYEFTERVRDELFLLEESRLRYLEVAARSHRWTGSIGRFLSTVARERHTDTVSRANARRVDKHRALLLERLRNLEEMGVDPALFEMAESGVETTLQISDACELEAIGRGRWVRTGAGVVTGLTGAAAVVVASGAAGTIIGGVTIAAALEAAGGAYLGYISEQETRRRESVALAEEHEKLALPEKKPFTRPDRAGNLALGAQGDGQGELQDPDQGGQWEESSTEGEGEGDEFEAEAPATGRQPRRDTIPATLPPPETVLDLPPLLDSTAFDELERLSLPEAQARLDEFLSLAATSSRVLDLRPEAGAATTAALIEEARAALDLWVEQRELAAGFGSFFVRAEAQEAPANRRAEVLGRAVDRYSRDRSIYIEVASIDALRQRLAERLVVHCRTGAARGDLMLQACADPTALTLIIIGAMRDAELLAPEGTVLGIQARGPDYHSVLFDAQNHEVVSLVSGERTEGVVAPIYHPASFYYGYLAENGVTPDVDPEMHLLIVGGDAGIAAPVVECTKTEDRNILGRVFDWLKSLVGADAPSRGAACGPNSGGVPGRNGGNQSGSAKRSGVNITLSFPRPSIPIGGGGQQGGGQGGGGGGGGGDGATPGGSPGGQGGGGGGGGNASEGTRDGAKTGGEGGAGGSPSPRGSEEAGGSDGEAGGKGTGGSGNSGGHATPGGDRAGDAVNLAEIAGEALELARAAEDDRELRLRPWQLRADQSFTPSAGWVLYADNERALARFGPHEQFVTMSPSSTEEQRRMFAADSFPVYPVGTECEAPDLPPRGVFRRATADDDGFRYVYCDHDESIIAFRSSAEAESYASLSAPDRPLLLTRLSSDRIALFQHSPEVANLREFLGDPDLIHALTVTEMDSLVSTTTQLLWLQERLEAALLQSMGELEGSGVREYYYELHRQVAQSPFLLQLVESVYRFNHRLASDPLRTLAWADALPSEHRQRFFELYSALGAIMYWPSRWATLHERYAGELPSPALAAWDTTGSSLDFLQVMSDPTRVHVDWPQDRPPTRPSIRDTRAQEGAAAAEVERDLPTDAEEQHRQEVRERRRGGTDGLGRTGEGEGIGPERGTRPLQMIRIRVTPQKGDPDRPRLPDDNPTRPGGTEGDRKVQEQSASRQEPALWLSPATFVDAILSGWDAPRHRSERAERVPAVLRFGPRLRDLFLREMNEGTLYEGRLIHAVSILTSGDWLKYAEVRETMSGDWTGVRAYDTGRYRVEYSTAAAIVNQEQVRGPDFFTHTSVVLPADLVQPVRTIFTRNGVGNFDLQAVAPQEAVAMPPPEPSRAAARESLLRALRLITDQRGGA